MGVVDLLLFEDDKVHLLLFELAEEYEEEDEQSSEEEELNRACENGVYKQRSHQTLKCRPLTRAKEHSQSLHPELPLAAAPAMRLIKRI